MSAEMTQCDVIVVGAGMAGASVAAELASSSSVVLLEREDQPGYHSTGRSAALFTRAYGPPVIRALTRASEAFLRGEDAANGGTENHLRPRGVVFVSSAEQTEALEETAVALGSAVTRMSGAQLTSMVPLLRESYAVAGLHDETAADIEVHGVHQHYLNRLKAHGGALQARCELLGLSKVGEDWLAETSAGAFRAPIVVNAAGAWADEVGRLAGVAPLGLVPKRRTAMLIAPPDGTVADDWPMVVDIEETFYLKPDAGKLLISPADETPSPPCDAQPEEMDVAICVERIETAFDISVRRIEHKWAGLRSFLPDGNPAVGYDAAAAGFFWLAGQGGYGIQTAPAMAQTAAALVLGKPVPAKIAAEGVDEKSLSPRIGAAAA